MGKADDDNRIENYVFGCHSDPEDENTNNNTCRGKIECGGMTLHSTIAGTKAIFEYNTSDKCIDVIFN
jgi:hypothetical protein